MANEIAFNTYTDGSSNSRPRRGGIEIRYVIVDQKSHEVVNDDVLPGHQGATNNEMELMAFIKALEGAHMQVETLLRHHRRMTRRTGASSQSPTWR